MKDLANARWMYAKGSLLLLIGLISSGLIIAERPSLKVALLLGLTVWAFARAYYFAFYVIEHYIDPQFRFSGLGSFVKYFWGRR